MVGLFVLIDSIPRSSFFDRVGLVPEESQAILEESSIQTTNFPPQANRRPELSALGHGVSLQELDGPTVTLGEDVDCVIESRERKVPEGARWDALLEQGAEIRDVLGVPELVDDPVPEADRGPGGLGPRPPPTPPTVTLARADSGDLD
jgi:hypothetical protein